MDVRQVTTVVLLGMVGWVGGCREQGEVAEPTPPPDEVAVAGEPTAPTAAPDLVPAEPAGTEAARAMTVPQGWSGTGVLSRRTGKLPKGAPKWAAVEAEVVAREGRRMLVASGLVEQIGNPALARSTAENRARAVMARWLGEERLEGAKIVDASWNKRRRVAVVKVEVEVPADWAPGT
ncbi:MAG: hypothetical protein AAB426_04375 [Myxococcota bacterium]